ncbi:MAG TPA: hypothetical protein VFA88_02005, partial [Gaiellaceae bacterium]|nr:hypothetical protein [Gaiellaceae bacterium]
GEVADRARRALGEAGARALALNAYEAAERFTASALELAEPDSEEWGRLVLQRVRAMWRTRTVSGHQVFERAQAELEAAGYLEAAAEVGAIASWSTWITGDVAGAETILRHAAGLLETAPPSRAEATVLSALARTLAMAGESTEAEAAADRAIAMAQDLGLADVEAEALNNRGLARSNAGDARAFRDLERSVELGRLAGSPIDVVRGLGNLASKWEAEGDLRRAAGLAAEALALAERTGIEGAILWMRAGDLELAYHEGRWAESLASALARRSRGARAALPGGARACAALAHPGVSRRDGARARRRRRADGGRPGPGPQGRCSCRRSSARSPVTTQSSGSDSRSFSVTGARLRSRARFSTAEAACAAVLLGRADDFLAAADGARETRRLAASRALARGEWEEAARRFEEIGSLPNAAFARLQSRETRPQALAFYRSVGAALPELLAAAG